MIQIEIQESFLDDAKSTHFRFSSQDEFDKARSAFEGHPALIDIGWSEKVLVLDGVHSLGDLERQIKAVRGQVGAGEGE